MFDEPPAEHRAVAVRLSEIRYHRGGKGPTSNAPYVVESWRVDCPGEGCPPEGYFLGSVPARNIQSWITRHYRDHHGHPPPEPPRPDHGIAHVRRWKVRGVTVVSVGCHCCQGWEGPLPAVRDIVREHLVFHGIDSDPSTWPTTPTPASQLPGRLPRYAPDPLTPGSSPRRMR
jgi:hypothetical protein